MSKYVDEPVRYADFSDVQKYQLNDYQRGLLWDIMQIGGYGNLPVCVDIILRSFLEKCERCQKESLSLARLRQ